MGSTPERFHARAAIPPPAGGRPARLALAWVPAFGRRLPHRPARRVRRGRDRRDRPARDLHPHGGRERLHPDPVGDDVPVRRLQRRARASTRSFAVVAVGTAANVVGLVDRLRRRLLRPHRHPREARPQAAHQAVAPAVGRPLVRALRRRDRVLHAHAARSSARSSRCPPAWRGCRSGASRCSPRSAASRGSSCSRSSGSEVGRTGRSGRTACTTWTTPSSACIVLGAIVLVVRWRRGRGAPASRPRMRPEPAADASR